MSKIFRHVAKPIQNLRKPVLKVSPDMFFMVTSHETETDFDHFFNS